MTLVLCIGALPFVFRVGAYAIDNEKLLEVSGAKKTYKHLLDDYKAPVGFTYGAHATLNDAYLWRGFYAGGMNVQGGANVGYGGLYLDMWWNIGVTDWTFRTFQPEVDFSLGFKRWGLNIFALYIHNFNCGFFDFANYNYLEGKGNRLELNASYTVSSKIPLRFLWATRVSAADGYLDANGELKMAYSSYMELSYTQALPYGMSLFGAVGMTPWKSGYTGYQGKFAVVNIDIRLRKDWSISEHCGLMLMGQLMIQPYMLSQDRHTAQWHPKNPGNQTVNANVGFGVYLK